MEEADPGERPALATGERPATAASERLPLGTKLLFGAPTFAGAAMVIPIGIYMTKFYADVVLVPLGYLGLAIALARSFDAITDPLVGWLSDRTRSPIGRRRPWLLVGGPLCGLSFWFLFSPPAELGPAAGLQWFIACYVLYFLFHTFYLIPHTALGAEITLDYHERTSLFGLREGFLVAGTLCAALLPDLLAERMGERAALSTFAAIFGTLLGLLYILLVVRVRERPGFAEREHNPFVPGVRRALRNGPFRVLLWVAVLSGIPGAMTAILLPFFTEYVIQPENVPRTRMMLLAGYFGSAFVFLPLWLLLSRRLGKRTTLLAALAVGTAGSASILTAGIGDVGQLLAALCLAGSSFGALSFLAPAMKADVIDHDELHTGRRREAQYTAFWAIVPKFVQIPSAALPIALLGSIGYVPNQPQTPEVMMALRVLFAGTPALCLGLSFVVALRFPIRAETHQRILQGIEAHARGETATDPITGVRLAPVHEREVDDATGWFLDHFSSSELRRLRGAGSDRLVRDVLLAIGGALVVFSVSTLAVVETLTDASSKPGATTVAAVTLAGVALSLAFFHLVRLRPALRLRRDGVDLDAVDRHLASLQRPGIR